VQGRNFVAQATTIDELQTFRGPNPRVDDPVRVYVGLRSADSLDERTKLAT